MKAYKKKGIKAYKKKGMKADKQNKKADYKKYNTTLLTSRSLR